MTRFIETDVSTRIFRLCSGVNESIMTAANEPSLGLYRVQEHSVNTIPKLVKERQALDEISEKAKGVNFDLSYDLEAVRDISHVTNFDTVLFNLKKAIDIKRLLIKRELELRQKAGLQEGATPTRSLPTGYGSTGESPPLLRRGGGYSINALSTPMGGSGKGFGNTIIQPKQF